MLSIHHQQGGRRKAPMQCDCCPAPLPLLLPEQNCLLPAVCWMCNAPSSHLLELTTTAVLQVYVHSSFSRRNKLFAVSWQSKTNGKATQRREEKKIEVFVLGSAAAAVAKGVSSTTQPHSWRVHADPTGATSHIAAFHLQSYDAPARPQMMQTQMMQTQQPTGARRCTLYY